MKPGKLWRLMLSVLLILSCRPGAGDTEDPRAVGGVIDFTGVDLSEDRVWPLRGEWEFYPGRLLDPSDFRETPEPVPAGLIRVPGFWDKFETDGHPIGGNGFGTYRLLIKIRNPGTPLALRMGSIHTAHRLFINGKTVSEQGVVGTGRATGKPMLRSVTAEWSGPGDTLELVMQVSNYHHRNGGIWGRIRFGTLASVNHRTVIGRSTDFLVFGALLIMGLFYLGMFLARRIDKTYLFFGLFCLVIAVSICLQDGAGYLLPLWPTIPWELLVKIEFIAVYLSPPLVFLFLKSFFKDRILEKLFVVILAVSGGFILFTLVAGAALHSWLLPVYHVMILAAGMYLLVMLIRFSLKKDLYARILLAAILLLFGAALNDILNSESIIKSEFLTPYGLVLFIFLQAFILNLRFFEVHNSVDRQKRQLVKSNQEFQSELAMRIEAEAHLKSVNENLILARSAIILGLAKIAEYRDSDTGSHLKRIQEYNKLLALNLMENREYKGYITDEYINDLYESSILHDIGKVGIPDMILHKPARLTPDEFEVIKTHPKIGGDAIKSIEKNIRAQTFLTLGREIAYMHHEKWDGTGYPRGLAGKAIALSARITALSDVYDALTTRRCYKEAYSHEKAVGIIQEEKGRQFDPDVVDAFLAVEGEFAKLGLILRDRDSP